ncbi:MAG: FGGY family carbohydrate kinase, partial [Vulcanimicrobiaceae bacterium]
MNSALLAGVDVGTSSVKLVACTSAGQVVANQTAAYGLSTPRPDWVEQDTREVGAVVFEALAALAAAARSHGQIVAIGFSTTMHGIVPVDADGTPLGPLITWMDRRSDPVAQRWRNDGTGPELYRRTGAPIH